MHEITERTVHIDILGTHNHIWFFGPDGQVRNEFCHGLPFNDISQASWDRLIRLIGHLDKDRSVYLSTGTSTLTIVVWYPEKEINHGTATE